MLTSVSNKIYYLKYPRSKDQKITHNLCEECHFDNVLWVDKVAECLDIPYTDILEKTTEIVEKVEKIKRIVEDEK